MAPEVRKDDQQEFPGRPDHHDDQSSIKQTLILSYKRNLYPTMKAEIHCISQDSVGSASGPFPSRGNLDFLHVHLIECFPSSRPVQEDVLIITKGVAGREDKWTSSRWEQFKVLLRRGLQERRHESYSGLRIFQVMSVSILSGLLWWHSDTSHIQDQVYVVTLHTPSTNLSYKDEALT